MSMQLKSDSRSARTAAQKEKVYQSFRKRAFVKNQDMYVDNGEDPKLLRLYMLGSKFNTTVEFLAQVNSFETIETKTGKEIGFKIKLKSPLTRKSTVLVVMRRQFKASLEIGEVKRRTRS